MKHLISALLVCAILASCSTTGGIYDKNDPSNSEFSPVRTLFVGVAVVGMVYGASQGRGGSYENPKWDYQQTNYQWVCRNAVNGQYLALEKCANQAKVDNWPNN